MSAVERRHRHVGEGLYAVCLMLESSRYVDCYLQDYWHKLYVQFLLQKEECKLLPRPPLHLLVYPEFAFYGAEQLGGAGSGLVSLARHGLDDNDAVAVHLALSGQPKLEGFRQFVPRFTLPIRPLIVFGQALGSLHVGLVSALGDTLREALVLRFLFAGG